MKNPVLKIYLLLIAFSLFSCLNSNHNANNTNTTTSPIENNDNSNHNNDKLVGEWRGVDKGKSGVFIFKPGGEAIIITDKHVMGGNGSKYKCRYEIDYSKSAAQLDFIFNLKDGGTEIGRYKGLVKFLTDTELVCVLNTDGTRPNDFSDDPIVLDKVSD